MELHQLRYFIAVAETGGFRRAAQQCNVAQPSLSQQIVKLEHELGVTLFDRLGRTVALTDAARKLLPHAKSILASVDTIKIEVTDTPHLGQLSVGILPTIAPFLLPNSLYQFNQHYPDTKIVIQEAITEKLIQMLVDGKIDLCIVSLPIKSKTVLTKPLFTEPLLVALPWNHPLAQRPSITTDEIEQFPFIALDQEHCLGEQVESFCYTRNIFPVIVCQNAQLTTVQHCVRLGMGISMVPEMLALTDPSHTCVYLPIRDEQPVRHIVAAWHSVRTLSRTGQAFIDCVQEQHRKLSGHQQIGAMLRSVVN